MRKIRLGWLIPIVVMAVALGVVGTLVVTGPPTAPVGAESPIAAGDLSASTDPNLFGGRGNTAAAGLWFDSAFTDSDSYPLLPQLASTGLKPTNVRFVLTGIQGWDFWVGRTDEKLCLLAAQSAQSAQSDSAIGCSDITDFAANGISLSMNGLDAQWNGGWVVTDPPTPAEPRVPPAPEGRKGDIAAANSWFTEPAGARNEFLYTANVLSHDIAEGHVRLAVTQNTPAVQVWVAQQTTPGFCLIATTTRAGQLSEFTCATVDDFRASGLKIAVPGLAAFWDGNDVVTTR